MSTIQNTYDRFCTERYPLPTAAQLDQLESRLGATFSADYRSFILKFNGGVFKCPEITPMGEGCPLETLAVLFGIGASHPSYELGRDADMVLFDDNDPPQIMPIGQTGMGGLIILDVAPGDGNGAFFLKKAFGDFYYLVDGIEAFLGLLREPCWEE